MKQMERSAEMRLQVVKKMKKRAGLVSSCRRGWVLKCAAKVVKSGESGRRNDLLNAPFSVACGHCDRKICHDKAFRPSSPTPLIAARVPVFKARRQEGCYIYYS